MLNTEPVPLNISNLKFTYAKFRPSSDVEFFEPNFNDLSSLFELICIRFGT